MELNFHVDNMQKQSKSSKPYCIDFTAREQKQTSFMDVSSVGPAGCINSTTDSLARWLAMQLNNGLYGEKRIVSEKHLRECHTPQMIIQSSPLTAFFPEISNTYYGLGWFIESFKERKLVYHGGNSEGYSSMQFFLPDLRFGASILTNSEGTPLQLALMYALIELFIDGETGSWLSRYKELYLRMQQNNVELITKMRQSVTEKVSSSLSIQDYEGDYRHPGYGRFEVRYQDGKLVGTLGTMKFNFERLSADNFLLEFSVWRSTHTNALFKLASNGSVASLEVNFEPMLGEMISFTRM
jgi:CubicO group peptidase (beta-lactamase class C family)